MDFITAIKYSIALAVVTCILVGLMVLLIGVSIVLITRCAKVLATVPSLLRRLVFILPLPYIIKLIISSNGGLL